jgi:hypothetical protein
MLPCLRKAEMPRSPLPRCELEAEGQTSHIMAKVRAADAPARHRSRNIGAGQMPRAVLIPAPTNCGHLAGVAGLR